MLANFWLDWLALLTQYRRVLFQRKRVYSRGEKGTRARELDWRALRKWPDICIDMFGLIRKHLPCGRVRKKVRRIDTFCRMKKYRAMMRICARIPLKRPRGSIFTKCTLDLHLIHYNLYFNHIADGTYKIMRWKSCECDLKIVKTESVFRIGLNCCAFNDHAFEIIFVQYNPIGLRVITYTKGGCKFTCCTYTCTQV